MGGQGELGLRVGLRGGEGLLGPATHPLPEPRGSAPVVPPAPCLRPQPAALTGGARGCGTGLGRLRIPTSGKQEAGIRK